MNQAPFQVKKQQSRKIILILATIGLIVILIFAILFFTKLVNLFREDISPINDSDLQLQRITVLEKDNAYFDLIRLGGLIYEPKDKSQLIIDMATGEKWDKQTAKEIVYQNIQAFECFSQAAHKSRYQNPASADPARINQNTVLAPMDSWRKMARLSVIKAIYLVGQGKSREALDEALNSVNIGQKIQESQCMLSEYLTAIAMKDIGLETIQKIIPLLKLTGTELKKCTQELNDFYKNENGLIASFRSEYHKQAWLVDSIARGDTGTLKAILGEERSQDLGIAKKLLDSYYFQPNKTKLLFAEHARDNIESATKACGKIEKTLIRKLAPADPEKLHMEENAVGKMLHDFVAVSLTNISKRKCQEDLLVGATQAMIAIKSYKKDMTNYPTSLNNLVPVYLSSVPQDPFDGKPLKYSNVNKILYSVGEDMQDSGGSIGDDWREMANPTFKISF